MPGRSIVLAAWEFDPTIVRSWSAIKRYWRYWRNPCARCGKEIDYDGYRYYVQYVDGKDVRVANQWVLDVGHIVNRMDDPRYKDGRYDSGAKYAPCETQPEHAYCNRSAGATAGNHARGTARKTTLRNSRQW